MSDAEATGEPSSVNATAPAGDELAELGELFPLAALADGAHGIHVGLPRPLRLKHHEFGRRLRVDGGPRVRHAGHRGHAAGQGGARTGRDRLVLFVPRLTKMNVNVDQPRANDHAPGIDHDLGLFVAPAHGQDPAPADPQIANLVDVLRGVDDPPAADLNGPHGYLPRSI